MQLKTLVAIALQFKTGASAQDKAATQLRKACRSRDKAKAAMIPAMAKAYGARTTTTKSGAVRWAKGCKAAAAAKRALNRLLSLAYQGKSNTKRGKVDAVALLVRKFGKLSAAQQRRFLNSVK